MNLQWNRVPKSTDIDSEWRDAYEVSLASFVDHTGRHSFSMKDIADIFIGAAHGQDRNDQGEYLANLFFKWREGGAVSLPTLLSVVYDFFDIDDDHPLKGAALTACTLGEIPHDNAYHNNHHFREVFVIAMRLCAYHTTSKHSPMVQFTQEDILLLLIAAAIHDFAHDGGDMIENENVTSRLERQSIKKASPFLKAAGMTDQQLGLIETMIICTDVLRNKYGRSPAGIARDIFLAHEHKTIEWMKVDEADFFKPLIISHKHSLMARMLCEADLVPSSGITYDFSKKMTLLIAKEKDDLRPNASTLFAFMEVVCHGGYDIRAGRELFGENFKMILDQVRNDAANGTVFF